jgi:hypothetical protein
MGLFETVGALGIPKFGGDSKIGFENHHLYDQFISTEGISN